VLTGTWAAPYNLPDLHNINLHEITCLQNLALPPTSSPSHLPAYTKGRDSRPPKSAGDFFPDIDKDIDNLFGDMGDCIDTNAAAVAAPDALHVTCPLSFKF
jgi:hypothetical protein